MANDRLREQALAYFDKKMKQLEKGIVTALNYAGNEAVIKARKNVAQKGDAYSKPHKPTYTVRTGNLVSSTGYVIVKDGIVKTESSFEAVAGKEGDGTQGAAKGKTFAAQKASESSGSGIKLIVVAGMPYAKYVQAKGYDVLNSAQLVAEKEARTKINDVIKTLTK